MNMLACIENLSSVQLIGLVALGMFLFMLESLWRNMFTPKSPHDLIRDLAKSDKPEDIECLMQVLDDDPTAWNAEPIPEWDIGADLVKLISPVFTLYGHARRLVLLPTFWFRRRPPVVSATVEA